MIAMMTMAMPAPAPSGVKRHATDDLENSQRLAKRFELLDLSKRPIATPRATTSSLERTVPHFATSDGYRRDFTTQPAKAYVNSRPKLFQHDSMELENTKHRVWVHDLDAELEEIESDEERPVFLSDIEKHLMKIPKHILLDDPTRKTTEDMQLVLYGAPVSLTVSEENDSVRRAVIESRRRAQRNQPFTVPDASVAFPTLTQHSIRHSDPDEMDIG